MKVHNTSFQFKL